MFPEFLLLCCFLTSYIILSVSYMSLHFDVVSYTYVTKTGNLLDIKTKSV